MIKISVDGSPAPQGSKVRNRAGAIYESSRKVGPWREAVRAETQRAVTRPLAGAVSAQITFRLLRPKQHFGTGRNAGAVRGAAPDFPFGKPDLDKLARAVLDGLTAGGAWTDDAQVVTLEASKMYAERAGVDIVLTEMAVIR